MVLKEKMLARANIGMIKLGDPVPDGIEYFVVGQQSAPSIDQLLRQQSMLKAQSTAGACIALPGSNAELLLNKTRVGVLWQILNLGHFLPIGAGLFTRDWIVATAGLAPNLDRLAELDWWIRGCLEFDLLTFAAMDYSVSSSQPQAMHTPDALEQMEWMIVFERLCKRISEEDALNLLMHVNPAARAVMSDKRDLAHRAVAWSLAAAGRGGAWDAFAWECLRSEQISNGSSQMLKNWLITADPFNLRLLRSHEVALQAKDEALAESADKLEALVHEYESTTSWRISAPIRFIGGVFREVRHITTVLLRAIEAGGGSLMVTRKAAQCLRREGLAGVRQRVVFLFGARSNYAKWRERYATHSPTTLAQARAEAMTGDWPTISIIMPTFNPKASWIKEAVDSVIGQAYPHWELIIVNDASPDPSVRVFLDSLKEKDSRICVIHRENNGHISAATNTGLMSANGVWVTFLDHEDTLDPLALHTVAICSRDYPEARLFYSDEDKITEKGTYSDPYFKPDWNYHLLLGQNLVTHLAVYCRDLLLEVGGLREGFHGAQDHDLVLRVIEKLKRSEIIHIPRVLYHWRMHSGSTAKSIDSKPYAVMAGQRAIEDHLLRTQQKASVKSVEHGYQVIFNPPEPKPKVSIVITTRNAHQLVADCIESIVTKSTYGNFEIVLIDNESDSDDSINWMRDAQRRYSMLSVQRVDGPFNFSALNNEGVRLAKGEYVCLMNNDITVITPDWMERLVGIASRPDVGAVGPKLLFPDDRVQHAGIILGVGCWAGHLGKGFPRYSTGYVGRLALMGEFSAVTGACLFVSKNRFNEVGGLDAEKYKVACNDVDFCLRLKREGYVNVYTPWVELYHHESATRGYEDTPEKKARFKREVAAMWDQWTTEMANDSAYNPNLTLRYEDSSLAWPPRESVGPRSAH